MRVTNSLATSQAISRFDGARQLLDQAQAKISSGHRFEAASEDPTAASNIMQNNGQIRALDQYQRNVGTATRRIALEESALNQLNDLLARAQELAVSQASDTASPASRQAAGAEVNQLLALAVQLSNSKDGQEYLFGGDTSSVAPFSINTAGATYTFSVAAVPPVGSRQVEIGTGERIVTNHDGTQVFGTAAAGPLKALQDLAVALQAGTLPGVAASIDPMRLELSKVQVLLGDTGARASRLETTASNITGLINQLTATNSDLQDVDIESAMTELVGRQTAYQAAMAATSRIMGLSLANYL